MVNQQTRKDVARIISNQIYMISIQIYRDTFQQHACREYKVKRDIYLGYRGNITLNLHLNMKYVLYLWTQNHSKKYALQTWMNGWSVTFRSGSSVRSPNPNSNCDANMGCGCKHRHDAGHHTSATGTTCTVAARPYPFGFRCNSNNSYDAWTPDTSKNFLLWP